MPDQTHTAGDTTRAPVISVSYNDPLCAKRRRAHYEPINYLRTQNDIPSYIVENATAENDIKDGNRIAVRALFVYVRFAFLTDCRTFGIVSLRRLAGVGRGPQWLSTAVEAWLIDRA